jgi:hypothetical protein
VCSLQVSCVLIHGHVDGIRCASTRCYRKEWEVLYVIAPHRIPTDLGLLHIGCHWYLCANCWKKQVFIAMLRFVSDQKINVVFSSNLFNKNIVGRVYIFKAVDEIKKSKRCT